ncbi:type II TA system antitoxin MqsA family protein [Trichloromonas sp.]|jgi:putative zinc finger/helix-turn-helix YgiT family protein|uniref:type II TA system antitoxin MqsA family protein n=1 Tax=Trichloromonas sp. TaxID=3069249 RepID=UPI002A4ADCCA|nr:helix-turn-helix domain-containing protein [Trichloromonas sp.]
MTCPDCRQAELVESRENIRYTESGLPYVTLCDILVERCPSCGNTLVNIPKMEQLHRLLATIVIKKSGRLEPFEITFLRKSLGWSKADFARNMHVRPSQVSHWESEHKPSPMGEANELLLRSLVAHNRRIENYFEEMANLSLSPQPHAQRRVAISHSPKGWFADEAA